MAIRKLVPYIAIVLCLLFAGNLRAEVIDKIVVVVNTEAITQGEIDRLLAPYYMEYRNIYTGDELIRNLEEVRQKIIEQLIEDKLILSEAKKLNVEPDERDVTAKLADAERRAGSRKKFERALMEQRLSIKDIKTRYREQSMIQRIIREKIGSRISVSPVEVDEYYKKNPSQFSQPEEIKLRNIFIKPQEGGDPKKAADLANEIVGRIASGGDFAALAKTYSEGPGASEGGIMGYVKKGDLLPELETAAFALKEGEISGVVQSPAGYHIFKMEEKKEAKALPLAEIKRDVEERVYREKVREKIGTWVGSLKKNAYIAFK